MQNPDVIKLLMDTKSNDNKGKGILKSNINLEYN